MFHIPWGCQSESQALHPAWYCFMGSVRRNQLGNAYTGLFGSQIASRQYMVSVGIS